MTEVNINGKLYRQLDLIGRGGSGNVYRVLDEKLKTFALKITRCSNGQTREECLREMEITTLLQGEEHVIQLYEYAISENQVFAIMEIGETDLQATIKKASLSLEFILPIWKEMLQCVHAIHKKRIIHSDLKPANFLFVSGKLKLIDFGQAEVLQPHETEIEREKASGTVNYMSPEQVGFVHGEENVVMLETDIWALGCILYTMCFGKPPFAHVTSTQSRLYAIHDSEPQFPEKSPLVEVIQMCLQKNPHDRPSVQDLQKLQVPRLR